MTRAVPGLRGLAAILGIAMAGCSPSPAPDTAAVRSAIEAANAKFIDAFKRGDKAALVAAYTEDAMVLMPNAPAWRGRAGVEKGMTEFLSQMTFKDGGTKTEDVMVAGDLAVETGSYAWTMQAKSGGEISDKGKYVTVWKRQADGSWKIARDINNSDLPSKQ
jgi:uncharacterized protein (TIGR02246 family)